VILTFAEDFSYDSGLDSELLGVPTSGYYWNKGVHPTITVENLKTFLSNKDITFADWVAGDTYGKFLDTRNRSDIVLYDNEIYQSKLPGNNGNQPDTSPNEWLKTNLDSLRIKSFIFDVEDNALAALSLNRMLIENQYIYNIGENTKTITDDFFGWAFEPKGSDYVTIRINQMSLQANTNVEQNVFVINQGRLIDTLTLTPDNGVLEFKEIDYTFTGKGAFYFVIQGNIEVLSDSAYNDTLKYKGFICHPVIGKGTTVESAEYSYSTAANGFNFNVSCYLDSKVYVNNNKIDLASFYRTQFEYDFMRLLTNNSHNKFNINERIQKSNPDLLIAESMDMRGATVAAKYKHQLRLATEVINNTFDKYLKSKKRLKVIRKTI
jgi:hypothetical protein